MSDKEFEKLMAKIDKQIESIPVGDASAAAAPAKKGAAPAAPKAAAPSGPAWGGEATTPWPAILRLALSTMLGIGVAFWPYENRCGVGLGGYLGVIAVLVVSGVWSSVWTWRHRTSKAHALSILLIIWGLVLGSAEVLPRTGYAKQKLPWSCSLRHTAPTP